MTATASAQKNPNMAGAIMFAALAGAVAGMLMAPKKGSETRSDIKLKMNEVKQKTRDQIEMAKKKAHDMKEASKHKAEETKDELKNATEGRKQVDDAAGDTQSRNHRAPSA